MCRLFIYKGTKHKLKELIWLPWNSILKQSFKEPYTPHQNVPNPRDHPINVDGFGICWYCEENKSCLYTNTMPPWNDFNLLNLTQYIETHLFFTHIRGVKPFTKSKVHQYNCHPFCYENISWMHNGDIMNPILLKNYVYGNLNKKFLENIKGNTDAEYAFHIFLDELSKLHDNKLHDLENWINALKNTIYKIDTLVNAISSMNFSITNGEIIVCSRYISINSENENPPSLYLSTGDNYVNTIDNNEDNYIIISSEPIDQNINNWRLIPKNSIIGIDNTNKIKIIGI